MDRRQHGGVLRRRSVTRVSVASRQLCASRCNSTWRAAARCQLGAEQVGRVRRAGRVTILRLSRVLQVSKPVFGISSRDPRLLHAGNCAARGFGPTDEHGLPGFRRGSRGARRSPRFGLMHSLHVLTRLSLLRLHLAHVRAERGYGACPARAR